MMDFSLILQYYDLAGDTAASLGFALAILLLIAIAAPFIHKSR